jgi:hypothetical protein
VIHQSPLTCLHELLGEHDTLFVVNGVKDSQTLLRSASSMDTGEWDRRISGNRMLNYTYFSFISPC